MLVFSVGAAQEEVEPDAGGGAAVVEEVTFMLAVGALRELNQAEPESEDEGGAAGGSLTARGREGGGVGLLGVGVFAAGGAAGAAVVAGGGVEDLGLSPAEGDIALTSSTGLFCNNQRRRKISAFVK